MKSSRPVRFGLAACLLPVALALAGLPWAARAGYAFAGQGMTNVLSGSVANGGLFWSTVPTWLNASPSLPYTNEVAFPMPACERVVAARLALTVWGGTADYVCRMTVAINGTNLPPASPFTFGGTGDTNAVFSANAPCAYGSGFGVWLVTLPVPAEFLRTDGAANQVRVIEETPDRFDGRIQHVTLVAVFQAAAPANTLDYSLAEGSGDIRPGGSPPQVEQRSVAFAAVNPTRATAATLTALYTYGDTGLNDELWFNGTPLGGSDVSQWDTSIANYGPSVVSFDVLPLLGVNNTAMFDVSPTVPEPRDGNLRPQLAALTVTRPATAPINPTLALQVIANEARLTITGEAGRTYTVLSSANLADWSEAGSVVSTNATSHWSIPATNAHQFFRVRAP